ncbi:hypothetical protein HNQ64_003736 [Prosthecobacter dejongeii]|uniref:Uncharacterized protein n=1 Tax=Prosthecobacter dejongeii TaxID=48465 RepID=A0A7W7YNR4_9BACT|nr:hypothetical protein [Prosthecobacter dejongeii]
MTRLGSTNHSWSFKIGSHVRIMLTMNGSGHHSTDEWREYTP